MKVKYFVLAAAMLPMAALAETSTKQPSNPGWEASVMGVYVNTDSARRNADYGLGLRVGLMKELKESFHIELAAFGNDIERKVGGGQDWQYGLGADALYTFTNTAVQPYALAGAGALYSDTAAGTDTKPYWNAGMGLMVREIWGALSLRADVRYFQDFAKDGSGKDPFNDVRFHVGVNFPLFGRTQVKPAQIIETERVVEVEVPTTIVETPEVLEGVNFEFDSSRLTVNAKRMLREVASRLRHHNHIEIEISGHTDSVGTAAYNNTLSQQRAEAVRNYLMELGIDGNRMVALGYGFSQPVASNDTEDGREQNRRIEMRRTN